MRHAHRWESLPRGPINYRDDTLTVHEWCAICGELRITTFGDIRGGIWTIKSVRYRRPTRKGMR